MPETLIPLISKDDQIYSVPVNIHRANVLWYSKKVFSANNLTPPKTFNEFFKIADTLKAKGIVPFVLGDKEGWESGHAFEAVLIGTLGAQGYAGLWTGKTPWTDARVTQALNTYKRMISYTNTDHAALTWDGAGQYLINGKGAMQIMGDWQNGWFQSKNYSDYGWTTPPGNAGVFDALSDSFALPKRAKDRDNALNWLRVAGSKAGQEAFNPKKGSICARTDCTQALFNAYLQSAAKDWQSNALVPSVVHGAAAIESWAVKYKDIMALFVTSGDVAKTQASLQAACKDASVCK
jgi:glucose/mannose transport system substrate-binding protein